MDASAIKQITDNSAVINLNDRLNFRECVAVPNGSSISSIEAYLPNPARFRGRFDTNISQEFINYINDNATENSAVFIDKDNMSAKSIIDKGDADAPQWGSHTASATLKPTPSYAALLHGNGKTYAQQEIIDFFEDWIDDVVFISETGEQINTQKALQSLRKVKVNAIANAENTVGNYAAQRSTLENIEIKSGADELPAGFQFSTQPYDDFDYRLFKCQLRASNSDKGPVFKFRIMQLENHKTEIADEFREKIKNGVSVDNVAIYLGNMAYQS